MIGIFVALTINLNFYSHAMAIENGYVKRYNNFYNNNYENDGYVEERNNDINKLIHFRFDLVPIVLCNPITSEFLNSRECTPCD